MGPVEEQGIRNGNREPEGDALQILVVDDVEADADLTREVLSELPRRCRVDWRADAKAGLEALRTGRYDAALIDYRLGGSSGIEIIQAIRSERDDIALILLTGESAREIDLAAMHAGAMDYIIKDELTPAVLDRAIRYARRQIESATHLLEVARRDALTGLHNRASILERIEQARSRADRTGDKLGICILDLDGFKAVNDRFGHARGDALLKVVAQRLTRAVRPYDAVGRLGGDEMVVVLEGLDSRERAEDIARRLVRIIAPPFGLDVPVDEVSASLGLALYPDSKGDAHRLLEAADAAMYVAKRNGKAQAITYATEDLYRNDPPVTLPAISAAARAKELSPVYHPQVDLQTGRIYGFEVLARWKASVTQAPSIQQLVAQLESNRAIHVLDLAITEAALEWTSANHLEGFDLSVNLSPQSLAHPNFLEMLDEILPLEAPRLVFELTESRCETDLPRLKRVLAEVKRRGIRIALDDFGRAESSLLRLLELPIDIVKIDRRLVGGEDSARSSAILESVAALGRSLGIDVVVEGVERLADAQRLMTLGLSRARGFLIAEPMCGESLLRWLPPDLQAPFRPAQPAV